MESAKEGYRFDNDKDDEYEFEQYDVELRLDVLYEDRIRRHRLIAANYVEQDWQIVLFPYGHLHLCAYSCLYSVMLIGIDFCHHGGRFVQYCLSTVLILCHCEHSCLRAYSSIVGYTVVVLGHFGRLHVRVLSYTVTGVRSVSNEGYDRKQLKR